MKLRRTVQNSLVIGLIFYGISACSSTSPVGPESDLVVIRAYLYAGEPITDIQITGTLPLGVDSMAAPSINDAEVYLLKSGTRFDLVPSPGDSGYYHYDGTDLTVEEGDHFEIGVVHFGRTATGATDVPVAPENVASSSDTLVILVDYFSSGDDVVTLIELTWDEVESALWYVTVENIEADPEPVTGGRGGFSSGKGMLLISPPRPMNEYSIRGQMLTHYGVHRVRVYRINQEYADLYGSRQQDTRDLNEPLTNISNGLGVFSAFSSVKFTFTAIPE